MKLTDIEEIIKKITFKMIDFKEGDMFFLSDLLDDLKTLHDIFKNHKPGLKIIEILIIASQNCLAGKYSGNPLNLWTRGFDLLLKIVENAKNRDHTTFDMHLLSDIKRFAAENAVTGLKADSNGEESIKEPENLVINSEAFRVFLVEAEEKFIKAQDIILSLEKNLNNNDSPKDSLKNSIDELFRIFHTIKGECGFLHLASMGELTHNMENLLGLLRNNEVENSQEIIDIMLEGIDYFNKMLDILKNGNITVFNQINIDDLIAKISLQTQRVKPFIGNILMHDDKISEVEVQKILQKQKEACYTKKFGEIAVTENYVHEEDIDLSLQKQKDGYTDEEKKPDRADPIVKVKASQINYLVDMIGELLIVEDQLEENDRDVIQLKKITKGIQLAAMQLRTVKIRNLFSNMKRVVRDSAKALGKSVVMELSGEELEIDRNLVELLDEPLIHILRNAVSHGIETNEERMQKNKVIPGKIFLSAERRGNNAVISIKDDGKGINEEAVIKKALSMSLIREDDIASVTKQQILELISLPGFSTAKEADNISGRGVGMDIVKATVTALKGKMEITSEKDLFTEIQLSFPLSMAIIDGMIVKVKGTILVIPISHIIESIQLDETMIHKVADEMNVIHLREEAIPVVELGRFFNMDGAPDDGRILAVIVEAKGIKYCFIVDEIIAKKEIVIKPLNSKFKELTGIAAGTILPGSKIGFILDIDAIVSR